MESGTGALCSMQMVALTLIIKAYFPKLASSEAGFLLLTLVAI